MKLFVKLLSDIKSKENKKIVLFFVPADVSYMLAEARYDGWQREKEIKYSSNTRWRSLAPRSKKFKSELSSQALVYIFTFVVLAALQHGEVLALCG